MGTADKRDGLDARRMAAALRLPDQATPFPWQTRLAETFLAGQCPKSLDLPTGLGKTSVMAIWLVARSLGASLPRRLVYVVDRRAVVDQATKVAENLRQWVAGDELVQRDLGLVDREGRFRTLSISTLRGKFQDNREWLEDPVQPSIMVGTVDMIGSRLLFEGYGISRKMRPYQAGFMGSDTLFVIDESHLVPPFERLLRDIESGAAKWGPKGGIHDDLVPKIKVIALSATGRSDGFTPFQLSSQDLDHPIVRERMEAKKALRLVDSKSDDELAEGLAREALEIAIQHGSPCRCLIFANSRLDAEKVQRCLERELKRQRGPKHEAATELLVGGRRLLEREHAQKRLEDLGFLAGSNLENPDDVFLIATSAGEVGVDLDADHLICDAAPWERMVQRLGRVNRRGRGSASVRVVRPTAKSQKGLHEALLARQAATLKLFAYLPMAPGCDDAWSVSPSALVQLKERAEEDAELRTLMAEATTPEPLRPALDRETLDAWALTSLKEHSGRPEVRPWLRGWVDEEPQTTLVWRKYLPIQSAKEQWGTLTQEFLEAAPPHMIEGLSAETRSAITWLKKRVQACEKAWVMSSDPAASVNAASTKDDVWAVILGDAVEVEAVLNFTELSQHLQKRAFERSLAGKTLVLKAALGGLGNAGLLEASSKLPALAVDQLTLGVPEGGSVASVVWNAAELGEETSLPVQFCVVLRKRKEADFGGAGESSSAKSPGWYQRLVVPHDIAETGEVKTELVVLKRLVDATTEEDRSSGPAQLLDEHEEWAEARARDIGGRLGLPEIAGRALAVAARLHDEGKRARRWQRAFRAPEDGVYAKAGPPNIHLLAGYRHEFGSLSYATRDPEFQSLSSDFQDLVLHLIASHHGYARPTISAAGCEEAPSKLIVRQQEVFLRYLSLQEKWGPWGLAWWESLLRAADQQASRANVKRNQGTLVESSS